MMSTASSIPWSASYSQVPRFGANSTYHHQALWRSYKNRHRALVDGVFAFLVLVAQRVYSYPSPATPPYWMGWCKL